MRPRFLMAMAHKGKLHELGVTTLEGYVVNDRYLKQEKKRPLFTPLIEANPQFSQFYFTLSADQTLTEVVEHCYQRSIDNQEIAPGPFGDIISIVEFDSGTDIHYLITQIAQKSFPKPGLAADLAIIIAGQDSYFLVTGVRKAPPGKGQPALIGGFRNISRDENGIMVFDSSAYTLLHEALEEAGLVIQHENPEGLRKAYTADDIPVAVKLGKEIETKAIMNYLDTIPTSDLPLEEGGELLQDGSKRVYATDGYVVIVDLKNRIINDSLLSQWLTPGDDIGKLQFHDITPNVIDGKVGGLIEKLNFGIKHHSYFIPQIIKFANQYHKSK